MPDVPCDLDGHYRRSYVLWKEPTRPLIVLEFASGDGTEERDATPGSGKFWIYERIVTPEYYGIFNIESGDLEFFQRVDGRFQPVAPNARGHYPFPSLKVELGVWNGYAINEFAPWMRWFDEQGTLIPTSEERLPEEQRRADEQQRRADVEQRRADEEQRRALAAETSRDQQERKAEALAAKLRALGVDPDEV